MTEALYLHRVSKRYAGHQAVEDLSVTVPAGTIYGILGPNGAGKSSTIRAALNIISRDTGEVRLLGRDPAASPEVLKRIGYLPEERGLYRGMRVLDVIVFFGRLKGMRGAEARLQAEAWLERMGLSDWRRTRVEALSKGMQQKVQFVATVLHHPDLLFLDEPSAGLDPVNQDVLRDTVRSVRENGRTVVFSTHNMNEAEQLCDSVCIISRGRKVLDGSLTEIRRQNLGNRWRIEYEAPSEQARALFEGNGSFARVTPVIRGWEVELQAGESPRSLLTQLAAFDVVPSRFEQMYPSLHEIFVRLVGGAAATPPKREDPDA